MGRPLTGERRKFRRETPETRRLSLIEAALDLVAEAGVRGATVREIAERGQVTQGLIRHYFSSKEELMAAAYAHHMERMTELTFAPLAAETGGARARLAALVRASLTPPVVDSRSIAIWASFLNKVRGDARMKATHERTYAGFRTRLEELIGEVLDEAGRPAGAARLHHLATACNAVIDGLWLEGGALPDAFGSEELVEIGLDAVGAIIGLELDRGETKR